MKALLFFALIIFSHGLTAQVVEKVQARVGDEMISLIDLKNFRKQLKMNLLSPPPLLKPIYKKSAMTGNKIKRLEFMVVRSMLFQIAEKENIPRVSEKKVEKEVRRLRKGSSHKDFSIKLARAGLNLKSLKQQILIDLQINLLLNQFVAGTVTVSEQDIESYHFNKYNQPLFKHFIYEFVSVYFDEDKKPALLKKLSAGESDLLKTAGSLALESKTLKLKEEDIQGELKKVLDKLSVSQISPVFILGGRYYVLQLKWKHPQISPTEQKKRLQIEKKLYQTKLNAEIKKWIEEKKSSFSIVQNSL